MQKWEYCAVVGVAKVARDLEPTYPAIWRFTTSGIQITAIHKPEAMEVAKSIAQLGEEGWELMGAVAGSSGHSLYFKRPK